VALACDTASGSLLALATGLGAADALTTADGLAGAGASVLDFEQLESSSRATVQMRKFKRLTSMQRAFGGASGVRLWCPLPQGKYEDVLDEPGEVAALRAFAGNG
jgi:hypothetical protein